MALIKCTNCGQMVSDKAVKCPKCGDSLKNESRHVVNNAQGNIRKEASNNRYNSNFLKETYNNIQKKLFIPSYLLLVGTISLYVVISLHLLLEQEKFSWLLYFMELKNTFWLYSINLIYKTVLIYVLYVIGNTFKEKKVRKPLVVMCCVALYIEALCYIPGLYIPGVYWEDMKALMLLFAYLLYAAAFLIMTVQSLGKLKLCVGMLFISRLCLVPIFFLLVVYHFDIYFYCTGDDGKFSLISICLIIPLIMIYVISPIVADFILLSFARQYGKLDDKAS